MIDDRDVEDADSEDRDCENNRDVDSSHSPHQLARPKAPTLSPADIIKHFYRPRTVTATTTATGAPSHRHGNQGDEAGSSSARDALVKSRELLDQMPLDKLFGRDRMRDLKASGDLIKYLCALFQAGGAAASTMASERKFRCFQTAIDALKDGQASTQESRELVDQFLTHIHALSPKQAQSCVNQLIRNVTRIPQHASSGEIQGIAKCLEVLPQFLSQCEHAFVSDSIDQLTFSHTDWPCSLAAAIATALVELVVTEDQCLASLEKIASFVVINPSILTRDDLDMDGRYDGVEPEELPALLYQASLLLNKTRGQGSDGFGVGVVPTKVSTLVASVIVRSLDALLFIRYKSLKVGYHAMTARLSSVLATIAHHLTMLIAKSHTLSQTILDDFKHRRALEGPRWLARELDLEAGMAAVSPGKLLLCLLLSKAPRFEAKAVQALTDLLQEAALNEERVRANLWYASTSWQRVSAQLSPSEVQLAFVPLFDGLAMLASRQLLHHGSDVDGDGDGNGYYTTINTAVATNGNSLLDFVASQMCTFALSCLDTRPTAGSGSVAASFHIGSPDSVAVCDSSQWEALTSISLHVPHRQLMSALHSRSSLAPSTVTASVNQRHQQSSLSVRDVGKWLLVQLFVACEHARQQVVREVVLRISVNSAGGASATGGGGGVGGHSAGGVHGGSGSVSGGAGFGGPSTALENDLACVAVLHELCQKSALALRDSHTELQDVFLSIHDRNPQVAAALVKALSPLFLSCPSLVDACTLALRKASFSTDVLSRQAAVAALTELLGVHLRHAEDPGTSSSSSRTDTAAGWGSGSGSRSGSRLGLSVEEILSLLRRFLQHQAPVRSLLYSRLWGLQHAHPAVRGTVIKLLHGHLKRYVTSDRDMQSPSSRSNNQSQTDRFRLDVAHLVDGSGCERADCMLDLLTTVVSVSLAGLHRTRRPTQSDRSQLAQTSCSSSGSSTVVLDMFTQVDYLQPTSSRASRMGMNLDIDRDSDLSTETLELNEDAVDALQSVHSLAKAIACESTQTYWKHILTPNPGAMGGHDRGAATNLTEASDISPSKVPAAQIATLAAILELVHACIMVYPSLPVPLLVASRADSSQTQSPDGSESELSEIADVMTSLCDKLGAWQEVVSIWHARRKKDATAVNKQHKKQQQKEAEHGPATGNGKGSPVALAGPHVASGVVASSGSAGTAALNSVGCAASGDACVGLVGYMHTVRMEIDAWTRLMTIALTWTKFSNGNLSDEQLACASCRDWPSTVAAPGLEAQLRMTRSDREGNISEPPTLSVDAVTQLGQACYLGRPFLQAFAADRLLRLLQLCVAYASTTQLPLDVFNCNWLVDQTAVLFVVCALDIKRIRSEASIGTNAPRSTADHTNAVAAGALPFSTKQALFRCMLGCLRVQVAVFANTCKWERTIPLDTRRRYLCDKLTSMITESFAALSAFEATDNLAGLGGVSSSLSPSSNANTGISAVDIGFTAGPTFPGLTSFTAPSTTSDVHTITKMTLKNLLKMVFSLHRAPADRSECPVNIAIMAEFVMCTSGSSRATLYESLLANCNSKLSQPGPALSHALIQLIVLTIPNNDEDRLNMLTGVSEMIGKCINSLTRFDDGDITGVSKKTKKDAAPSASNLNDGALPGATFAFVGSDSVLAATTTVLSIIDKALSETDGLLKVIDRQRVAVRKLAAAGNSNSLGLTGEMDEEGDLEKLAAANTHVDEIVTKVAVALFKSVSAFLAFADKLMPAYERVLQVLIKLYKLQVRIARVLVADKVKWLPEAFLTMTTLVVEEVTPKVQMLLVQLYNDDTSDRRSAKQGKIVPELIYQVEQVDLQLIKLANIVHDTVKPHVRRLIRRTDTRDLKIKPKSTEDVHGDDDDAEVGTPKSSSPRSKGSKRAHSKTL